jgi:ComF family protein
MNWIHHFIDLIYPRNCEGCKKGLLAEENLICTECLIDLPLTNSHKQQQDAISKKFWGKLPVQYTLSYLKYNKNGIVQNMIHSLKYQGNQEIGKQLGEMYGKTLRKAGYEDKIDLLIGVPLHEDKMQQRGYNQADCIAEGLSIGLQVDYSTEVIKRSVFTESQTKKSRIERFQNVENIFEITNLEKIKDKRIALVDDVLTTGSTLESCGLELLKNGCKEISIITIASAY